MLSHPKDPIPTMKKSGVVYRIPCADCDTFYVGQTGRNLSLRIKEHKKAVKTFNTDTSALAEHILSKDHHINWEETTVIGGHPFTNTRCIVESWFNSLPGTINREKGLLPDARGIKVIKFRLQIRHKDPSRQRSYYYYPDSCSQPHLQHEIISSW